jgi:hypothetical protein
MPNWLCVELASIPSKHPEQSIPSERNEFALHTEQATRGSSCTSPSLTCAEFTPHAEFTSHADLPMCRVCEHPERVFPETSNMCLWAEFTLSGVL